MVQWLRPQRMWIRLRRLRLRIRRLWRSVLQRLLRSGHCVRWRRLWRQLRWWLWRLLRWLWPTDDDVRLHGWRLLELWRRSGTDSGRGARSGSGAGFVRSSDHDVQSVAHDAGDAHHDDGYAEFHGDDAGSLLTG